MRAVGVDASLSHSDILREIAGQGEDENSAAVCQHVCFVVHVGSEWNGAVDGAGTGIANACGAACIKLGCRHSNEQMPELSWAVRQDRGGIGELHNTQRRKGESAPACAARFKERRRYPGVQQLPCAASGQSVAGTGIDRHLQSGCGVVLRTVPPCEEFFAVQAVPCAIDNAE